MLWYLELGFLRVFPAHAGMIPYCMRVDDLQVTDLIKKVVTNK